MLPLFESFIALYSVCLRTVELTPQRAFGITIPMKNQVEMDDAETGSKYIVVDCINGSFFLFSKKGECIALMIHATKFVPFCFCDFNTPVDGTITIL